MEALESEKDIKEDEFGEYCEIPLITKKYQGIAKVDPDQYEKINRHKWYMVVHETNKRYACRALNLGRKKSRKIYMHRQIMNLNRKRFIIDHINGDGLDNRKHNLRLATQMENQYNRKPTKNTSSRYKGVHVDMVNHKRVVKTSIQAIGKKYQIYCKSLPKDKELAVRYEIEAARAYDKAASILHREFAYLNFPEEGKRHMSYVMTPKERKRARKLHALFTNISNRKEIEEKLRTLSIDELKILCHFHGCNVSQLAGYMK